MPKKQWVLTIFDRDDVLIHCKRYGSLKEIAHIFGLHTGSDLLPYRKQNERAQELMLERWGVWFDIDKEDQDLPEELAVRLRQNARDDDGNDDSDSNDDDDSSSSSSSSSGTSDDEDD